MLISNSDNSITSWTELVRCIDVVCFSFNKLTLSCWTRICPAFANRVDPDQLASSEANWSGSALFAIKYVNL